MRARTGIAAIVAVLSAAGVIGAATTAGASTGRPAAAADGHGSGFGGPGFHDNGRAPLIPGDLLVSESYYIKDPGLIAGTTQLPPGSASAATAIANGTYPQAFNNDTTGTACPNGTGLPAPGATLPTAGLSFDPGTLQKNGLPSNMCVLAGFPTALAKNANDASDYPFGLWFASPTTLYLADEGSGDNAYDATTGTYSAASASTTAGLQKWVLDTATGQWKLAYTLSGGLKLGMPYTVAGYPAGVNQVTGLPWAPATDGLRNITGHVNRNGTVTIWGVTSTVSGGGDQGADPNQLVAITDSLAATAPASGEAFRTVIPPAFDKVVRGVSFTPGT
jgi:hypothetical protein